MSEQGEVQRGEAENPLALRKAEAIARQVVQDAKTQADPRDTGCLVGLVNRYTAPFLFAGTMAIMGIVVLISQSAYPEREQRTKNVETSVSSPIIVSALTGSRIPDKTWIANSIHVAKVAENASEGTLFIVTDKSLSSDYKPNYNIHLESKNPKYRRNISVKKDAIKVTTLGSLAQEPADLVQGTENLIVVGVTGLGGNWLDNITEYSWLKDIGNNLVTITLEDKQPDYSVQSPGQVPETIANPKSSVVEYQLQPAPVLTR